MTSKEFKVFCKWLVSPIFVVVLVLTKVLKPLKPLYRPKWLESNDQLAYMGWTLFLQLAGLLLVLAGLTTNHDHPHQRPDLIIVGIVLFSLLLVVSVVITINNGVLALRRNRSAPRIRAPIHIYTNADFKEENQLERYKEELALDKITMEEYEERVDRVLRGQDPLQIKRF